MTQFAIFCTTESDFDDDLEPQRPERPNLHFINELNENVCDPIFGSDSEGELDDVYNDLDYLEDPTICESEEDNEVPDNDVGLGNQPSTSTVRPSIHVRPKPKRRRSDKLTDDEVGFVLQPDIFLSRYHLQKKRPKPHVYVKYAQNKSKRILAKLEGRKPLGGAQTAQWGMPDCFKKYHTRADYID